MFGENRFDRTMARVGDSNRTIKLEVDESFGQAQ